MKPYYDDGRGITIYHGDCREIAPSLQVGSIVTDPPYGIALRNGDVDGHRRVAAYTIVGDDDATWVAPWLHGTADGRPLVAFASPWKPWAGKWRNLIVWDKGGAVGGGGDIATCLKRSWELIQVANNGPLPDGRHESVWRFPLSPADTSSHIAAKPLGLLRRLIRVFATGTVLDPFMGSGTTLRAAKDLGRKAIGIEIEERYCEIAAKRLEQEVLNLEGV